MLEINIQDLRTKQRALDDMVIEQHGIVWTREQRLVNTVTALVVELAEMANDARWFKVWSLNQEPKETLVEEYVDCIHFYLSIFNQLEDGSPTYKITNRIAELVEVRRPLDQYTLRDSSAKNALFISMVNRLTSFITTAGLMADMKCLALSWVSFMQLGEMMNLSADEITKAYHKKWQENIDRQKNGY